MTKLSICVDGTWNRTPDALRYADFLYDREYDRHSSFIWGLAAIY